MFIDRPVNDRSKVGSEQTKLIVAKNRHGVTGEVELVWDAPRVRFLGLAHNGALEAAS
jgi:replicative DNA helicase